MSLREAYTLAHTAQCRLNLEASRPDRNLRFVVGHLMHYESLRLRIVEIEQEDLSRAASRRNSYHRLQHQPSTCQLGRKASLPTPARDIEEDVDDYDDPLFPLDDEDAEDDNLSLSRFPSGSSRVPPPPPSHLEHNADTQEPDLSHSPSASSDEYSEDEDDYDDDFLISYPSPPSPKTLHATVRSPPDEELNRMYESVRGCRCHHGGEEEEDVPAFERMWKLSSRPKDAGKGGRRRKGSVTVVGEEVAEHEGGTGRRGSVPGFRVEEMEVIEGVEV